MPTKRGNARLVVIGIAAFLTPVIVGFAILFAILQKRAELAPYDPRVRHRVTDQMVSQTERMATQPAPEFAAPGTDGKRHTLRDLLQGGPLLITFINVDCPCSVDAEPMFQAFANAYPGLTVVGVVGASEAKTRAWSQKNHAGHLLLADPDFKIIHAYGAIASIYTVLVTPRGKIAKMWPGYWQDMMAEVSAKAADLLGVPAASLPPRLAPAEKAAGCAFPGY
jgi:peroxiredoxin